MGVVDMNKIRALSSKGKKILLLTLACVVLISGGVAFAVNYQKSSTRQVVNNFEPGDISVVVQENENDNTTAEYSTELAWVQDTSEDTLKDTFTAKKEVTVKNLNVDTENNVNAYVRVAIIPRWIRKINVDAEGNIYDGKNILLDTTENTTENTTEYVDVSDTENLGGFGANTNLTISGNTFTMGKVTFTLADGWRDKWFYNSVDGYFYYKIALTPGDNKETENSVTSTLLSYVTIPRDTEEQLSDDLFLRVDIVADAIQTEGNAVANRWGSSVEIDSKTGKLQLVEETID
jgi:hypothetical protein